MKVYFYFLLYSQPLTSCGHVFVWDVRARNGCARDPRQWGLRNAGDRRAHQENNRFAGRPPTERPDQQVLGPGRC